MHLTRYLPLLFAGLFVLASASAQDLAKCRDMNDRNKRLDCYDQVAGRVEPPAATGLLAKWWGYDTDAPASRYQVSQHYPNYVTVHDTNHINTMPTSPTQSGSGNYPTNLDAAELKFQLSAKVRVFDLGPPAREASGPRDRDRDHDFGVWLAYTQQSYWQIFNAPLSRPFLETDYQPEAIFAFRPQLFFGTTPKYDGVEWQLLNIGLVHQSNGQSDPLSRSWNRVYAQFGFEKSFDSKGDLVVLVRPWYRFKEQQSKDDNPDIQRYYGYGDVTAVYRNGPVLLSLMGRGNPSTGKGAGQLDLAFPLPFIENAEKFSLKGFVQVFSGYGESLIDYNWRQTTISAGVMLNPNR